MENEIIIIPQSAKIKNTFIHLTIMKLIFLFFLLIEMDMLVKSVYGNIFANLRLKLNTNTEKKESGTNRFSLFMRTRRAVREIHQKPINNLRNYRSEPVQKHNSRSNDKVTKKIREWLKSINKNTKITEEIPMVTIINRELFNKRTRERYIGPDPLTKLINKKKTQKLPRKSPMSL